MRWEILVTGGKEHWWCFHAQEGEFSTSGLSLVRQEGGTLAGPGIPYGDPKWLQENGCTLNQYGWNGPMFGFAHLYNVERGQAAGVWSADWALKNADGLHLRLTVPVSPLSPVQRAPRRGENSGR